jgi:hypothetical protein
MSDTTDIAVRAAAGRVALAWLDAGPVPEYHAAAQVKLLAEWPTLARAVHDLALAVLEDGTG